MDDWGWVIAAMAATYGSLAAYWWSLARRTEAAQRRLEGL